MFGFFLTFLNWEKQIRFWVKRWLFSIGNGVEIGPLEKGKKSHEKDAILIKTPITATTSLLTAHGFVFQNQTFTSEELIKCKEY